MELSELMLGDYVLVETDTNTFITDQVCSIDYVPQWNEIGIKTLQCGESWLRASEVSPILLTRGMLEQNGFPFNKEETEGSIQDVYEHYTEFFDFPRGQGFYIEHDTEDNVYWISDHCWMRFKHVHEFQHVLRMCHITKDFKL